MSKIAKRRKWGDIERYFIARKSQGVCWYCGCESDFMHVDHVVPLCDGGTNDPHNVVIACPGCNTSKGRMSLAEFREYSGTKHFWGENPNEG